MRNAVELDAQRKPFPRLGTGFAVLYLVLVVVLFALIAIESKPSDVGLEWMPLFWLALPWSRMSVPMGTAGLIPGFLINAAILWILGTAIQALVRGFRSLTHRK
jgi:hypothetical protein